MQRLLPLVVLATFWILPPCTWATPSIGTARDASPQGAVKYFVPLAHAGADSSGDDSGGMEGRHSPGGWSHFVRWVGHFHPAMTVFPIAMLLGAALAELLLITTGKSWLDGASRWCVIVGAVGAVITAPLGWAFAAGHGGSRLLEIHRWLGTAAAAGAA